jgi:glycosyltransferase involved in cell wall biosynthesis
MVFSPDRLETMSRIPAAATLYWTGDEVTQPGERELLEKVDLILAISPVSYAEKDHLCPGKVRRVSTGIDFERYHKVLSGEAVPVELENMKGPIVGYAGSLYASRVDLDLLLFLARKHDGMNFVLVGPLDETAKRFFRVNRVSNLHVLGAREYERMPYYIKRFDVGLIPYRLTRFNLGCNPLKLYEYFALGKPVVSMALPSVEEAGDLVRIGRNPDEFNEQLGRALEEKDDVSRRDARVRYAEEHGTKKISRDLAGWAEEAVSLRRGPAAGARK